MTSPTSIVTSAITGAVESNAKSIVRTVVPIVIGFGVSILAHLGIKNPVEISAIGSGAAVVYYTAIRTLETRWPKVGVLLGAIGAPLYKTTASVTPIITTKTVTTTLAAPVVTTVESSPVVVPTTTTASTAPAPTAATPEVTPAPVVPPAS